ncbi:MAG: lytic transglycosylase domain-containing protein, partial [Xanthomonadales bacterium]|nr:lytic transglycosylase domain-containing protein [Xanthomonadales bacterium]
MTRRILHGLALVAGLLLAGCTAAPRRPAPIESASAAAPAAPIAAQATPSAPAPADTVADAPDSTPWQRMRARFVLDGCGYSSEVERWARQYTRAPQRFAESWQPAMPFLLLVLDEIERRGLPGEFALLPYVESRYRPLPSKGNLPAGMWQLMPATARDRGLLIDADYDGRLDAIDSTRVALDLIERYDREFGDWRVATMAFNAGEFRLKRQLAGRDAAGLDAGALARLELNRITHDHLARMLALACIVSNPERFAVELPLPRPGDPLVIQPFDARIDLRVAARAADLPEHEFARFNAAHRG